MSIKCQHADEYRVRSTEYRHLITNPYPKQNALSVDLRLQRYYFFLIYTKKNAFFSLSIESLGFEGYKKAVNLAFGNKCAMVHTALC